MQTTLKIAILYVFVNWCWHICIRWNICTCKLSQEAGKGCGIGEGLENKGGGGGKKDGGPSAENFGQIGLFLSDFEKLVYKKHNL